jgi:hypothetical protein
MGRGFNQSAARRARDLATGVVRPRPGKNSEAERALRAATLKRRCVVPDSFDNWGRHYSLTSLIWMVGWVLV